MFSVDDIRRQLLLGEASDWEFKQIELQADRPKRPRRDDLADEIAAFANADGGVLLCGVTDDGNIPGMSRKQLDNLERQVSEICSDSIKPPIRPRIYRLALKEGFPFLLVEIPEGHSQHERPGGSFYRTGSTKRRIMSDERLRLAQKRRQTRNLSFDKQAVSDTGFRTLEESLWKPLLSQRSASAPELALQWLGLLVRDNEHVLRATVARVLLCTESPEEWIQCARITATFYRGATRASGQIDAQTITGPLDRQIAMAASFAIRNMRTGAHKAVGRIDLPQYSDKALFEATVNAVAHRDYSIRGSAIRLAMFEDRVEINSPGSLPNNLTTDSIYYRTSTRNEVIVSVLGRMPVGDIPGSGHRKYFMERRGDGIPIIVEETEALNGVEPKY